MSFSCVSQHLMRQSSIDFLAFISWSRLGVPMEGRESLAWSSHCFAQRLRRSCRGRGGYDHVTYFMAKKFSFTCSCCTSCLACCSASTIGRMHLCIHCPTTSAELIRSSAQLAQQRKACTYIYIWGESTINIIHSRNTIA